MENKIEDKIKTNIKLLYIIYHIHSYYYYYSF